MKSASESKCVAPRVLACATVAIIAAAPAAWAQNSQRPDEGTGAPNPSMDMSTPGTNGNTAAPPPPARMQQHGATRGTRSHSGSAGHVKPGGGPNGAGAGGSGAGNGNGTGAGNGNGSSPGSTGTGGGGAGGAGSAGSSGY
ncbi:hypothetical protein LGM72_22215 [Burkholderia contaminans]|uniref:hypothetical protein n=1 Tax=Burkholderia contaminans TaxID=488447 RepID=UPI001CF40B86|nr:hypothetical protein [Burkholderia contaminans]MCA8154738.1 hypothetical protein [Burkholderia contaminans]